MPDFGVQEFCQQEESSENVVEGQNLVHDKKRRKRKAPVLLPKGSVPKQLIPAFKCPGLVSKQNKARPQLFTRAHSKRQVFPRMYAEYDL